MAEKRPCDICGNHLADYSTTRDSPQSWERVIRNCPRCGDFEYDGSLGLPKTRSPEEIVCLSGWVRDQNAAGVMPVRITSDRAAQAMRMPKPGLRERANRILSILSREYSFGTFSLDFITQRQDILGKSYSLDQDQLRLLLNILESEAHFTKTPMGYRVSPYGMLTAEALGASGSNSTQGFVAMGFKDDFRDAWTNGFDPGIRAAGFRPVRIDDKDYVGGITDETMAEIRRSRFVVADYTGQRNNVYFEAGFALGLGLTVIQTCRADEAADLHFDIRHLNTLAWKSPAELAEGLDKRIRAVIGAGPEALDPS